MTSADCIESSRAAPAVASPPDELDSVVTSVEKQLKALADALRERDPPAIEFQANELQRALSRAVACFVRAAHDGGVPEPMRRRLARASGQVAAQRDVLSRATAALDRAIDVLMPGADAPSGTLYSASGLHDPLQRYGSISA